MKLVVTVVGKDRVGIIAMVSQILAENNVNILNINQNIMDGFFNMVMIAEISASKINLAKEYGYWNEKSCRRRSRRRARRSMSTSRHSMKTSSMLCTMSERRHLFRIGFMTFRRKRAL